MANKVDEEEDDYDEEEEVEFDERFISEVPNKDFNKWGSTGNHISILLRVRSATRFYC